MLLLIAMPLFLLHVPASSAVVAANLLCHRFIISHWVNFILALLLDRAAAIPRLMTLVV